MRYGRLFLVGGLLDPVPLERDCARRGLDLRYAWSDRRLASFVLAVPQWIVQRHGDSKRIVRRAMEGIMPPAVVEGAGKIEPSALFDRGLLERERSTVMDLFTDSQLAARGFVDEAVLRGHYEAMLRREPMRMDPWWSITMEMWLRAYWT
jgi:asparagine synthase (glutamine-hydrolysing)